MTNHAVTRDSLTLFPTPLWVRRVDGWETLNTSVVAASDAIMADTPNGKPASWGADVYTTISNNNRLQEHTGFRPLMAVFQEGLEGFARAYGYALERNRVVIKMCWLNAYRLGAAQERHTHKNFVLSAIYYAKAPPGAAPLLVHAPDADRAVRPAYRAGSRFDKDVHEVHPEPGLMVIFLSHLRHSVPASTIEGERLSISLNAAFEPV